MLVGWKMAVSNFASFGGPRTRQTVVVSVGSGTKRQDETSSEQGTPLAQACHWFGIGPLERLLEVVSDQVTVLVSVLFVGLANPDMEARSRDFSLGKGSDA